MVHIDKKITADMVNSLKKLVGSEFTSFRTESFHFDSTVFGQVEINAGQTTVYINASLHVVDYFGSTEDVSILSISTSPYITEDKYFAGLTVTPIRRKINEIHVVQEQQSLFEDNHQIYNVEISRGIIFVMDDGFEVSFEKTSPFTELISISSGKNLINGYTPFEDIVDGFSGNCTMSVSRSIDIIA